jgi:hypothetical protein
MQLSRAGTQLLLQTAGNLLALPLRAGWLVTGLPAVLEDPAPLHIHHSCHCPADAIDHHRAEYWPAGPEACMQQGGRSGLQRQRQHQWQGSHLQCRLGQGATDMCCTISSLEQVLRVCDVTRCCS